MDKIYLVARREYLAYVTAWGFWLGLLFTPLIIVLAAVLPSLIEQTQPARYYTVIGGDGQFEAALDKELSRRLDDIAIKAIEDRGTASSQLELIKQFQSLRDDGTSAETALSKVLSDGEITLPSRSFIKVAPPARTLEALKPYLRGTSLVNGALGERPLYAAFIVHDSHIEFWSEDVLAPELQLLGQRASEKLAVDAAFEKAGISSDFTALARKSALEIQARSPSVSDQSGAVSLSDRMPFYVALGLSGMLWLLIFSVVNYLLTGTIEERSNKIFDTLLTSVTLTQLLSGKLLGVLGLSLTLIGVWGGVSGLLALSAGDQIPAELALGLSEVLNPGLLVPTLVSFALGYLMYGAMFLALGSLCDSIQEAQALLSPIFIVMMIPLLMLPVSINSPDSPLLEILSWVPLLTPFLLILRIPADMPVWMIALQIAWMALFTFLVLKGGTRVYRAGAVHGAGLNEARGWFKGLFGKLSGKKARG